MDTLSQRGAMILRDRIDDYWREKGFRVNVRVQAESSGSGVIYVVRSDLLYGKPRDGRHQGSRP